MNNIIRNFELIWGIEEMLPMIDVQEGGVGGDCERQYVIVGRYDDMSRAAQSVFDEMRKRKPWTSDDGVARLHCIAGRDDLANLICESAFEFAVRPDVLNIGAALRALNDVVLEVLSEPRFFTDEIRALMYESASSVSRDAALVALCGERNWEPHNEVMRGMTAFFDSVERAVDDMLRIADMLAPQGYRFVASCDAFRWTPDIDAIRRALIRFPIR